MNDTHSEAERVQIELLRKAGPGRRAAMAIALTDQVVKLSKRAIAQAHPNKSPQELLLLFIAVHYGKDLSRLVRDHLARRTNSQR